MRAWLHAILVRTCTEVRRVEGAAARVRDAMPAADDLTFDQVPILEAREELRTVPRGLTRHEVAALDAFLRNNCNLDETAAALRLPMSTVHSRLRDARAYLRHRRNRDHR